MKKNILIVKETCWNAEVTCCKCPRKTTVYNRSKTRKSALSYFDNDGYSVDINGWYINAKTGRVLCPICNLVRDP